jgi:hypothetical protein
MKNLYLALVSIAAIWLCTKASPQSEFVKLFVQKHIDPTFWNFPPWNKRQFAVMVGISKPYYIGGAGKPFNFYPAYTGSEKIKERMRYPQLSKIGNYLLARDGYPGKYSNYFEHAEEKILEEVDRFVEQFKYKTGKNPFMILLYTRVTPCGGCSKQSINANLAKKGIKLVLAYSTNHVSQGESLKSNAMNRYKLWQSGIPVYCVPLKENDYTNCYHTNYDKQYTPA